MKQYSLARTSSTPPLVIVLSRNWILLLGVLVLVVYLTQLCPQGSNLGQHLLSKSINMRACTLVCKSHGSTSSQYRIVWTSLTTTTTTATSMFRTIVLISVATIIVTAILVRALLDCSCCSC